MKYKGVNYSKQDLEEATKVLFDLYNHNLIGIHADPDPLTRDVLLVLGLAEDAPQNGFYRISNDGRLAKGVGSIYKYLNIQKKRYIIRQIVKLIPIATAIAALIFTTCQYRLMRKSFEESKNSHKLKREIIEITTQNAKLIHEIDSLKAHEK